MISIKRYNKGINMTPFYQTDFFTQQEKICDLDTFFECNRKFVLKGPSCEYICLAKLQKWNGTVLTYQTHNDFHSAFTSHLEDGGVAFTSKTKDFGLTAPHHDGVNIIIVRGRKANVSDKKWLEFLSKLNDYSEKGMHSHFEELLPLIEKYTKKLTVNLD